jgi:hypothetical protein
MVKQENQKSPVAETGKILEKCKIGNETEEENIKWIEVTGKESYEWSV